jgi:ParB/RepB/Spo0J family partition protein
MKEGVLTASATAPRPRLVDTAPLDANSASVNIPLSKIIRSETNREPEVDDAFVQSIRESGVLQPIIVREIKATIEHCSAVLPHAPFVLGETIYKLVAGERRFVGSKKAGRVSIPAMIRDLTDTQAIEIQVEENEQRKDLSPLDRSRAYCRLRDQYMKDHAGDKSYSATRCIEDVAANRKVETRTVHQVIALSTKLTSEVQQALRKGEIELSHAYEFCREGVEQQELLLWLRRETHHSQGDIPSVRRLKDQIKRMGIAADEKKRQQPLPLQGETSPLDKLEPGMKSWLTGEHQINQSEPATRTVRAGLAGTREVPIVKPKPLSAAQIKKAEDAEKKRQEDAAKQQRENARRNAIDKKYQSLYFAALSSKALISSRFLTHVVPSMLLELWDCGYVAFDSTCQEILGWPAPKLASGYEWEEVRTYSKKHTRKFTAKLLAALILSIHFGSDVREQLGKYYGVDPKKIRARAKAEVKAEEKKAAALKKKGAAA